MKKIFFYSKEEKEKNGLKYFEKTSIINNILFPLFLIPSTLVIFVGVMGAFAVPFDNNQSLLYKAGWIIITFLLLYIYCFMVKFFNMDIRNKARFMAISDDNKLYYMACNRKESIVENPDEMKELFHSLIEYEGEQRYSDQELLEIIKIHSFVNKKKKIKIICDCRILGRNIIVRRQKIVMYKCYMDMEDLIHFIKMKMEGTYNISEEQTASYETSAGIWGRKWSLLSFLTSLTGISLLWMGNLRLSVAIILLGFGFLFSRKGKNEAEKDLIIAANIFNFLFLAIIIYVFIVTNIRKI